MDMDVLAVGTQPPWIIAHRGVSQLLPENTHPAFEAALRAPVAGIELDLQLSADGVPVVYHHRTLARAGLRGKRVHLLDFATLRELDVAGWLATYLGHQSMPTLDEVLDRYGGRTRLFLEVKARKGVDTGQRHRQLALRVVEAVAARGLFESVYILSFDRALLTATRKVAPALHYVLNTKWPVAVGGRRGMAAAGLFAVCIDIRRLTPTFAMRCHAEGVAVITYTCNSQRAVRRAVEAGVDAMISDHPFWLAGYLDGHRVNR
jgi:glycerophosphoryl diester phosphodiesterase